MIGTADLTADRVADLLGITAASVRRRCQAGDLPARKILGRWRIKVGVLRHRHPDLWAELVERAEARDATAEPRGPLAFEPGDVV